MQGIFVDTGGWDSFWNRWRDTIEHIPGMKEALLEKAGRRIQWEVREQVTRSGLHDPRGRVKRWQNPHVGSGLGYVAVRADSVEVAAGNRDRQRLNAGALTNYLTSGHKTRMPSGRAKRYQPRARMTRVKGLDFYRKAHAEAEKIALQEAEAMLQKLTEELRL